MRDTPAHARHAMLNEEPPSAALDFGWAVHIAILEPERLEDAVMEIPKVDRRTTKGKLQWAAFEEKAQGRMLVTAEQMEKLRAIRQNVLSHPTAREMFLGQGQNEASIVWKDAETGVLCKGRLDRLALLRNRGDLLTSAEIGAELTLVVDVKTMGDPAQLRTFERQAHNYGYFEQAAMYLDGLQTLYPLPSERPFVWVVAETEPPYAVRCLQPDDNALAWGRAQYRNHLAVYAKCTSSGQWPAWEDGIETCSIPPWVNKVFELQQ